MGWSPYSVAYSWNALLKPSVLTLELFPQSHASRICVRSPCGVVNSHTFGAIVGSRRHSSFRVALLDTGTTNEPVAINVIVVGTDRCSLCAKAVLSVRRIISSLSPPLVYERLPDNIPSVCLLGVLPRTAQSPRETNFGLQVKAREEDAVAALGATDGTARVSLLSAVSGTKKGPPDVFSLECNEPRSASTSLEGERRYHNGGSAKSFLQVQAQPLVRVRVGLASLDSAEDRKALGICDGDVQHLKEVVPIVLVGGKPVSRLKFNGPAVRAELLQELKTVQAGLQQTLKAPDTN